MTPKQRPSASTGTSTRASMIDHIRTRQLGLAPVPDLPAVEPEPAAPAAEPKAARPRKQAAPPMPAEQPPRPASKPDAFPARLTLQLTRGQAQELADLCNDLNRETDNAGRGKPYSVNPMIRAALDLCLSDRRLKDKMIRQSLEPEHTGRPPRAAKPGR